MGKQQAKAPTGGCKPNGVNVANAARSAHVTNNALNAVANNLEDVQDDMEQAAMAEALANGGVRTSNPALQARLEQWAALCSQNKIREFCTIFVPPDLSAEETAFFASELEQDAVRWSSLAGEILAIVEGSRVFKITGDQQTQCEFKFLQLENAQIQREVVFVCQEGDWRAEG
mmetsp:Transcript_40774/g.68311  ORF Transcript_40774/g.68311 Transcript_40774/m.68311 type:complete len:173 (+) Transcript_40774:127-645(+)|eukprot:CAMPEP_0198210850 /NCGR_PEP_ID=MMETSP1445-20131203/22478_1 /TAXON_ID=36898 /ORGANISM="Pyramimonas sp., Strain CCMP2087" /LENGTH=172 /DNA_ID=CAMNT_0043885007 /DNA_START=102 /DNA_END=620 /DNA_ORIENTATION=+